MRSRFSLESSDCLQNVSQRDDHALAAERLVEEVDRAGADRFDRSRRIAVPGNHHDRQPFVERAQLAQDLHAVHARHLDVEQHDVRPFAADDVERFLAAGGADELVVLVLEDHPQRIADRRFVVDDQHTRFHGVGAAVPSGFQVHGPGSSSALGLEP